MKIPTQRISFDRIFRIIADKFPPIGLFERIADPSEWDDLLALEALTGDPMSERMRDQLARIAIADRYTGTLAGRVMAPFVLLDQLGGGRFSNADFGAYYAGDAFETAVLETVFHAERFLRDGMVTEPQDLPRILILASISGELHDIRELQSALPEVYTTGTDYVRSQAFAIQLINDDGSQGIIYSSVRRPNGQCVAVFRPALLQDAFEHERRFMYRWNGEKVSGLFFVDEFRDLPS